MLKKRLLISFITILFVLMSGCQLEKPTNNSHLNHSSQPNKNEIKEMHGQIENIERLNLFVENVKNKKMDKVRLVRYTIEGDPIFHDLDYNGSKLSFILDSTKDKYGQGEKISNNCKSIQKLESDTKTAYILKGCSDPKISELLTISHDIDKEDYFAFELKYGAGKINEISTRKQELIIGKKVAIEDFQFSKEEMNKIYKLLVFSNYLGEKKLSKECNQKPYVAYELTIWINSAVRHYEWTECDNSYDGKEMTSLVQNILKILKNNAIYKTLPEVDERYK